MSQELAGRLAAALGGGYRIEQELGGGGMSRVFLAEEVALRRQVVVKVLPPEMAAGVNQGRFRREIQLAAGLQHPHIVPLHTAGSSGDLLWYTMPMVEGESLRTRLARHGELPIKEAVQILREVADALAYAHHKGVVHRDIKPDNVMLSSRHALVTDFGVAKAVSESSGELSLTSLGLALGTPSYMAPEQAAAEPHVDHRADIYAFGAMAYEMLVGRPPFSGMTAQATLAAHVTLTPEPVTLRRPAIPPALGSLVMRCLEKRPADRWQSAEELIPHLEALLTPSGGSQPTAATPALTSDARAAIRRTHPVRITLFFALAAIGALAIVWLLVQRLGLPAWVFVIAIALLIAGLPIMLFASRAERHRLLRGTGPHVAPPTGLLGRLSTIRGAALGGVLAFAILALGAGSFMILRANGVGPFATLLTAGTLKDQDRIVIADFDNRTADSLIGPSVTEALRIDFTRSPVVRAMDASIITPALLRMRRDPGEPLTPALAAELAEREGAAALIVGEISSLGAGFNISARVVTAADGRTILAERETAPDAAGLIAAVDRLSRKLREGIGESLRSIRAGEPLEDVTTPSLEALREFTLSRRSTNRGDFDEAERHLKEALRHDSTFAAAWRGLAVIHFNTGQSAQLVGDASRRAYELRDRLPEVERLLVIGFHHTMVEYDEAKLFGAYRRVLELRPDNRSALVNLGNALVQVHRYGEAEEMQRRTIALYPSMSSGYLNIATPLTALGKEAALDSFMMRGVEATGGSARLTLVRAYAALSRERYGEARRLADSMSSSRDQLNRQVAGTIRAAVFEAAGQFARASRERREAAALSAEQGNLAQALVFAFRQADADVGPARRPEAAARLVDSLLRAHPFEQLPPEDRPWLELAQYYYRAGKVDEGDRALASTDPRKVTVSQYPISYDYVGALGQLAKKNPTEALDLLRKAQQDRNCERCGMLELANAYDALQQSDSAISAYERFLTARHFADTDRHQWHAPVYFRLGELYEARGDRKKAAEHYDRFVDRWRNADAAHQSQVADARRRLAALAGEPRNASP